MSISTSNLNPDITTLNYIIIIRENLNYITKFRIPPSITQHINTCLIFYDVHIDDLTTPSDMELNLWVFNHPENYQLSPTLVIYRILNIFYNEFHRWRYTKFSKLDWHIRGAFKKTSITKRIYIAIPNGYINQRLANFVINK